MRTRRLNAIATRIISADIFLLKSALITQGERKYLRGGLLCKFFVFQVVALCAMRLACLPAGRRYTVLYIIPFVQSPADIPLRVPRVGGGMQPVRSQVQDYGVQQGYAREKL